MSSDLGNQFGVEHHEKYAAVLETWTAKVADAGSADGLEGRWGAALLEALGEPINAALLDPAALAQWSKRALHLPSPETLKMFAQIAAKYSLAFASTDLLRRLVNTVKVDKANPEAPTPEGVTAAGRRFVRPRELVNRAAQTLAQTFDMAKDSFNAVLGRFFKRKQKMTGRRKWVAVGDNSRHAALDGEIRDEGDLFSYKKTSVYGPRPPGGSPAEWSGCSCSLVYERSDGQWV